MKKTTIFDTETTGFLRTKEDIKNGIKQSEMVQIASITSGQGGTSYISEVIKPEQVNYDELSDEAYEAMAITGITKELVDEKGIKRSKSKFLKMVEGDNNPDHILVAHNAKFDIEMLRTIPELDKNFNFSVIDTLVVAQDVIPEVEKHSLQFLRYRMGYYKQEAKTKTDLLGENVELKAHDALSDVVFLVDLYKDLIKRVGKKYNLVEKEDIQEKMIDISTQTRLLKKLPMTDKRGETFYDEVRTGSWTIKWLKDKIDPKENFSLHMTVSISYILGSPIRAGKLSENDFDKIMEIIQTTSREGESLKNLEKVAEILGIDKSSKNETMTELVLLVSSLKDQVNQIPWKREESEETQVQEKVKGHQKEKRKSTKQSF